MARIIESLKTLEKLRSQRESVVSLYLRLFPEDRADRKYLRVYKNLVKAQKSAMERSGIHSAELEKDYTKIESFLSNADNLKNGRGVAVFSCSEKGVFEAVTLPYVYRNRLMVSTIPMIKEIAAIDEEFGRILVVLLDRKHARFFMMDMEEVEELKDIFEALSTRTHKFHVGGARLRGAQGLMRFSMPSRKGAPNLVQHGVGEYRFHTRLVEEKHRLFKAVNDALMEIWKEFKFDKLVIGSEREDIQEIENFLHTYILERFVGYVKINPSYVNPSDLVDKVLELLIQKEKEGDRLAIQRCKSLLGRLAICGVEHVLRMLQMGNVRELLVPLDYSREGYLCSRSYVPSIEPVCPMEDEEPIPVADILNEMIEMAFEERAKVRVIVDSELQSEVHEICAILRFAV